jgi:pyruvate carboxylase
MKKHRPIRIFRAANELGLRTVFFELNGQPRTVLNFSHRKP